VIGQVIQMFGHLDLFIDCSTIDRKKKSIEKGGREAGKPSSAQNIEVFANSNLTRAALHALAS
jgi:hypothetical protein